ncbi:MAG TPA: type II toxin-antitoxin system RelE/ParE family toxin [Pyrinomonadaceae bacterium]|jgi:plasmid stabilization system protein ParE|nr:type II toxin-antitoxin system RelE/ParE family toxin [Pyrinomonadaceae bacterium]
MRVRLHPEARAELRDARRWYYDRSPLSATAFAHAVDHAVSGIVGSPTQYPLSDHGTRKVILQRFPFNIFYLTVESEIVIVAVAHQKRRPGYWSSRVTE